MEDRKNIKLVEVDREQRIKRAKEKQLKNMRDKAYFLKMLCIFLIALLCIRILYIKVVHGKEYEKKAIIQATTQETEQVLSAKRGDILDRTGKTLAVSSSVYDIFIDIIVLDEINESTEDVDEVLEVATALNEVLGYPIADFEALFEKDSEDNLVNNTYYYVIAEEVSSSVALEIDDLQLPAVHLEENGKRVYPYNTLASQTVGFIGGDGKNSNWGLENYYDEQLTGTDGRYFIAYDDNHMVRNVEVDAIAGNSLITTIDLDLQAVMDELVDKYGIQHNCKNASIIVMKPDTGEIVAMSEYPRFDNNSPGDLSSVTDPSFESDNDSLDDENKGEHIYKLWRNFNVSDTFEPGSIFKPIVVASALEEGVISNDDVCYCGGYRTFSDGTRVKCWIYDTTGGGHGAQTIEQVLANSCNVGMMEIGDKLGSKLYAKYQQDFGIGSVTGIDLPGEEDANELVYDSDQLNQVELATGSFGQGFNATPIQDLIAFNATINGGYIVKPYVVSDIVDSEGNVVYHKEPEILRQVISEETSDIVRNDLAGTVDYGTGKNLAIDGYSIGGKTGTAEQGVRGAGRYAISFAGFLPVDDPEYVAIGILNEPDDYSWNHTSAVPMMREVFLELIRYYNIPSDVNPTTESPEAIFMQDYTGDVVSSVETINSKGYSFEISGSGSYVYKQVPNVGQQIDENTTFILYVSDNPDGSVKEMVEIPDVLGLSVEEAQESLSAVGLDVKLTPDDVFDESAIDEMHVSSEIDEGEVEEEVKTIKKQMPKSGISLPKGTEVRLVY